MLDVVCWNSCEACVSIPEVLGCTNPEFLEYDPYATADDALAATCLCLVACTRTRPTTTRWPTTTTTLVSSKKVETTTALPTLMATGGDHI